jgi:hypothetical protein
MGRGTLGPAAGSNVEPAGGESNHGEKVRMGHIGGCVGTAVRTQKCPEHRSLLSKAQGNTRMHRTRTQETRGKGRADPERPMQVDYEKDHLQEEDRVKGH